MNQLSLAVSAGVFLALVPPVLAQHARRSASPGRASDEYVIAFVGTASTGIDMNGSGDVVGTSYADLGCGSFCLPPRETVVWRGGERLVLPSLPGLSGVTVKAIDDEGLVVGYAGVPGTTTRAVVWRLNAGGAYEIVDLGTLPGTTRSLATGVDALGRVVGYSSTGTFPTTGAPFVWSEGAGMVDLTSLGFPDEEPVAISPGGTVATSSHWYRLDEPASITPIVAPPSGFFGFGDQVAINDAGDQARFLVTTSGQNLSYLFRYHREGTWQLLSTVPTGNLSRYGIGSIDAAGTVTGTIASTGIIARGPNGLAQSLTGFLAAPYVYPDLASTTVTSAGPMNERGEILAQVLLGRSTRLVRLVPAKPCAASCLEVQSLLMDAVFVQDPSDPGHCSPALSAHDEVTVSLIVASPSGAPQAGVQVSGRFLDDYWTDHPVTGTTDASGSVAFFHSGPCGVGAIEFLVDGAQGPGTHLDRTRGSLTVWDIPH